MTYRAPHIPKDRPDTDFFRYFNDFLTYSAGDWTITTTEGGSGNAAEALSTTLVGGVLVVTNDDADDDSDEFQLLPAAGHFRFVAGKKLGMRVRFQVSDATDIDLFFGLAATDTTLIDGTDDLIAITKNDGDAYLDANVGKNGTASTQAEIFEIADDTWYTVEMYYDGDAKIHFFVNEVRVASLPITNAPDDEELRPSFAVQNGEAAAKILYVDYIDVFQER